MTNVRRTKIAPDEALSVIAEIGHVVNSTLEIDDALGEFARLAKKLISYDRITVATFNADRTGVVVRYAEGDGKLYPS